MDFIKINNDTNIILVTVPPRYELMQSSCMNSEIKSFHRKLQRMVKAYQHTSWYKWIMTGNFLPITVYT